MKQWPIVICTKGRPQGKTFKLLEDAGLKYKALIEPQEWRLYKDHGHSAERPLNADNQGIAYTRNAALAMARDNGWDHFWLIDDDVDGFYIASGGKCKRVQADILLQAQEQFLEHHFDQAALEYQQFAWSQNGTPKLNSYCDVVVALSRRAAALHRYDASVAMKEDRDFTLQILANGGLTVRSTMFAFSCPSLGKNEGGLHDDYAARKDEDAARRLAAKWPGIVTVQEKKSGRVDAKINWRAFRSAQTQ